MKKKFLLSFGLMVMSACVGPKVVNEPNSDVKHLPPEWWIYVAKVPSWMPDSIFKQEDNVIQWVGRNEKMGEYTGRLRADDSIVQLQVWKDEKGKKDTVVKEIIADIHKYQQLLEWLNEYTGEQYSTRSVDGKRIMCFDGVYRVDLIYFCHKGCFLIDPNYCSPDKLEISRKVLEILRYSKINSAVPRLPAPSHVPSGKNAK